MLPSERGFAQGVTHAGSRLGGAVTPLMVVSIIGIWGWRAPFFVFGLLGVIWAAIWFWYYRDTPDEHAGTNEAERELIHSSLGGRRSAKSRDVPWRRLLSQPTLWYLCAMYACYAYCISVYLDWFPTYLNDHRGFSLRQMGFYAMLPLLAGAAGNLVGGWGSDELLRRGMVVRRARQFVAFTGFTIAALGIVPATLTPDPMLCVLFSCLGVFGLELTVGVAWAIPLDIGGDYAGSASAIMNTCGNIGGAISPALLAYLVEGYGWETPFLVASGLCVAAAVLWIRIDASRSVFTESA
jgi:sugar phosphate permease